MTLARLLAAAIVICSLPAFAQDQPKLRLPGNFFSLPCWVSPSTPTEPWRIFPDQPPDLSSEQNALSHIRTDQYRFGQPYVDCIQYSGHKENPPRVIEWSYKQQAADTICYAIRSYVVARDSKHSDSTHPAGYSTCQPSNRFQVKTADMRVVSGDR